MMDIIRLDERNRLRVCDTTIAIYRPERHIFEFKVTNPRTAHQMGRQFVEVTPQELVARIIEISKEKGIA